MPKITATVKTGGQTIKTTVKPPSLTAAQTAAERSCIQSVAAEGLRQRDHRGTAGNGCAAPGDRWHGGGGAPARERRRAFQFAGLCLEPRASRSASPRPRSLRAERRRPRADHHPGPQAADDEHRDLELHRRRRRPDQHDHRPVTKAQLVSGTWFTANPADEVLVNTAYASTKKLKVGGTVTINEKSYKIVGLVTPTLTGNVSDIYFPLATMQSLASASGYVNEVLVAVRAPQT